MARRPYHAMEVTPLHHEDHCAFGEVEDIETKEYKHVTLSLPMYLHLCADGAWTAAQTSPAGTVRER